MGNKKEEEYFSKARNTVFRLLKFRLHSEKEIREKLRTKNLPVSVITQTIEHFKGLDLIDDRMFAQAWTSSRLKKPFGINRIRLELKTKGVGPAIIEAVIKEETQTYEELEIVTRLAQYRASKYRNIDPEKIRQRVYGYLLRRGFSISIIIKAVKAL